MPTDDNIEAKKILDFLAKKIGYEEVVWSDDKCIVLTGHDQCMTTTGSFEEVIRLSSLYVSCGILLNGVVAKCKSHSELLDKLLKFSSASWDIQTIDGLVFLPAKTTLEKILIWMDLEGRKEIEKESDDARQ